MTVKYIFNGTTELHPVNSKNNFIQLNFDQESVINQVAPYVGIKNLYFGREDVAVIKTYMDDANGGVFYAPTFDIVLSHQNVTQTINCYIDLTEGLKYSKDGVQVSIKLYSGLDWLEDRIDGFTFESLFLGDASLQALMISQQVYVPYVISRIPNYQDALITMISIFSLGVAIYNGAQKLADDIAKGVLTTALDIEAVAYAASIVYAPVAATPAALSIYFYANIALDIIYLVLLIAALILLILQLINTLIQPLKYVAGMFLIDMLQITCTQLGLTFNSSIWDVFPFNQMVYIPQKYQPTNSNPFFAAFGVSGYTSPDPSNQRGYMMGTGGDLLRLCKTMCNGKIIINNANLILERRDYNLSTPLYSMPKLRMDWNGYNTSEFHATTLLKFQSDLNDKNTIDKYSGQVMQTTTLPNNAPNPLLVCTKGERTIEIAAARGVNKTDFTFIENILIPIIDFVDIFTGDSNSIENRLNAMLLENDMIDVPKIVLIDRGGQDAYNNTDVRLHPNNLDYVNAAYLWNKFYCIDSWKPLTAADALPSVVSDVSADIGKHNQFTLWTPELNKPGDKNKIPFSFDDFLLFLNGNKFLAIFADGQHEAFADSIDYHFEEDWGEILMRRNEIYDNNLKIIKSLPTGQ